MWKSRSIKVFYLFHFDFIHEQAYGRWYYSLILVSLQTLCIDVTIYQTTDPAIMLEHHVHQS